MNGLTTFWHVCTGGLLMVYSYTLKGETPVSLHLKHTGLEYCLTGCGIWFVLDSVCGTQKTPLLPCHSKAFGSNWLVKISGAYPFVICNWHFPLLRFPLFKEKEGWRMAIEGVGVSRGFICRKWNCFANHVKDTCDCMQMSTCTFAQWMWAQMNLFGKSLSVCMCVIGVGVCLVSMSVYMTCTDTHTLYFGLLFTAGQTKYRACKRRDRHYNRKRASFTFS